MKKVSHRKGELLVLTGGAITYCQCSGVFRVAVDLDLGELAEAYCRQAPYRTEIAKALEVGALAFHNVCHWENNGDFSHRDLSEQGFGHYLINRGYLELVRVDKINCGMAFSPDRIREALAPSRGDFAAP